MHNILGIFRLNRNWCRNKCPSPSLRLPCMVRERVWALPPTIMRLVWGWKIVPRRDERDECGLGWERARDDVCGKSESVSQSRLFYDGNQSNTCLKSMQTQLTHLTLDNPTRICSGNLWAESQISDRWRVQKWFFLWLFDNNPCVWLVHREMRGGNETELKCIIYVKVMFHTLASC